MVKNNKNNKNSKGSALVFAMILIANAIIIVSSMVFLIAIQAKSSGALYLTTVAFQQVDSGVEHVLKEINGKPFTTRINNLNLCTGNGGGYDINSSTGKCVINDPKINVYFLSSSQSVLKDSSTTIEDVGYLKIVGEAKLGSSKVSRSLRVSLYTTP